MTFLTTIIIIVLIILFIFVLPMQVVLVYLIKRREKLRGSRYYIISHAAMANIVTTISIAGIFTQYDGISDGNHGVEVFRLLQTIGNTVSLLVTLLLSIDRYIAVTRCLNCSTVLLQRQLKYLAYVLWIVTVIILSMFYLEKASYSFGMKYRKGKLALDIILRFIVALTSTFICRATIARREKQLSDITSGKLLFSDPLIEIDSLKKAKQSIHDTMKLSGWIVSFQILIKLLEVLAYFFDPLFSYITPFSIFIYACANPVVMGWTQVELRNEIQVLLNSDKRQKRNSFKALKSAGHNLSPNREPKNEITCAESVNMQPLCINNT